MTEPKHTPFYSAHVAAGGKMVDFAGWNLPIHYGSQIKEHEAVRTDAGMFDVSHMLVSDVVGDKARAWLNCQLSTNSPVPDSGTLSVWPSTRMIQSIPSGI